MGANEAASSDVQAVVPGGGRRSPASGASMEAALDALAGVLRTLGEFAFDTRELDHEEARQEFEAWARHVLVATPPTGEAAAGPSESGPSRDWAGLSRFVSQRRRSEYESIQTSLDDLRETIWIFISGIGRALPAQRASDGEVGRELATLKHAVDANDSEAIRACAVSAIDTVERAIAQRQESTRQQAELLAVRVERVVHELMEARETADLDPLTGLCNRSALDALLERMVHLAELSGRVSTLFVVEIDDLAWVIEHFGEAGGEAVLKDTAGCLIRGFNRRGDLVARTGVDAFAVVVQTDSARIDRDRGEHVLQAVRDLEVPCGDDVIRVSLSIGSARLAPGEGALPWTARAQANLAAARKAGRDRLVSDSGP